MMESFYCPQCGEMEDHFQEGVCIYCCKENQEALDDHNRRFDEWNRLSDNEREKRIKESM